MRLLGRLLLVLVLTGLVLLPAVSVSAAGVWQPSSSTPIHWQWQIGTPFNMTTDLVSNVTVYDIDAFDTSKAIVDALHALGFKVIAYVSFGTYENWRPDAGSFPSAVKGSSNGWPGENWLDIRSQAVKDIMSARLDMIVSKGFDAVEPDNIDGYSNSTGFPLTAQNQLDYNEWIAATAHSKGLSVGLKNDIEQVSALEPYFDWCLNEESYKYNEYQSLSDFVDNGKAVFEIEYGSSTPQAATMNNLHINSMTRDLDLVAPGNNGYKRLPCIPDTQNAWTRGATTTTIPVETTVVSISPSAQEVDIGSQFSVNVDISPGGPIAGAQFSLSFDPLLVSVDGIEDGLAFGQNGSSTYFSPGTVDNVSGTVKGVVCVITVPGQTISGSGVFATITMTAISSGTCNLVLSNVIAGNIEGKAVSIEFAGATVTVASSEIVVPTSTPTTDGSSKSGDTIPKKSGLGDLSGPSQEGQQGTPGPVTSPSLGPLLWILPVVMVAGVLFLLAVAVSSGDTSLVGVTIAAVVVILLLLAFLNPLISIINSIVEG